MILRLGAGLILVVAVINASPVRAETTDAEPTREDCEAAMDKARRLAQSLPQGDLSRYMAERTLMQAETEAGSNDFDECVDYANSAEIEVREHRHALRPGETFPGMPVPPQK